MQLAPETLNTIEYSSLFTSFCPSTNYPFAPKQENSSSFCPDSLCKTIVDSLQYGILVVTDDRCILYANSKAQEFCRSWFGVHQESTSLSSLIGEICNRWNAADVLETETLIMEYLGQEQQKIRITVQNLPYSTNNGATPILILLENCNDTVQVERSIACQKYALTDRETEVWNLLQQRYTYQETAKRLGVSINTIKTHVKNIHSKEQHYQQTHSSVWFSR